MIQIYKIMAENVRLYNLVFAWWGDAEWRGKEMFSVLLWNISYLKNINLKIILKKDYEDNYLSNFYVLQISFRWLAT